MIKKSDRIDKVSLLHSKNSQFWRLANVYSTWLCILWSRILSHLFQIFLKVYQNRKLFVSNVFASCMEMLRGESVLNHDRSGSRTMWLCRAFFHQLRFQVWNYLQNPVITVSPSRDQYHKTFMCLRVCLHGWLDLLLVKITPTFSCISYLLHRRCSKNSKIKMELQVFWHSKLHHRGLQRTSRLYWVAECLLILTIYFWHRVLNQTLTHRVKSSPSIRKL